MNAPLWQKLLTAIATVALVLIVLSSIPTNYRVIEPHAPIEVAPRLMIGGERIDDLEGTLYLVGVTERRLTLTQKWLAQSDPRLSIEPHVRDRESRELQEQRDRDSIRESKKVAAYLAYRELGEPVELTGEGVFVDFVDREGPSDGKLKVGDRITALNGKEIAIAPELSTAVAALEPGTQATLRVRRKQRPMTVTVTTEPQRDDSDKSRIGIAISTFELDIELPKEVTFTTRNIGGPSAGLAFALAVYDAESAEQLLAGRSVVATGALSLDGSVVPVGGVRQKAIAAQDADADLLLVPRENAGEAVRGVRIACDEEERCTDVLAVRTYSEAVELLRRDPLSLEREFAN